jgi:hypothetical protein
MQNKLSRIKTFSLKAFSLSTWAVTNKLNPFEAMCLLRCSRTCTVFLGLDELGQAPVP